jgi:hypothetical protein
MQARIEERLWQAILTEEADRAPRARRRSWREAWLRPLVATGAALGLAIAVAVVSDGGAGITGEPTTQVTQASGSSVLDRTAGTLFGRTGAGAAMPISGTVDLTTNDDDELLAGGPSHVAPGELDPEAAELARTLPRDPAALMKAVRGGVRAIGIDPPDDHHAFRLAMRWVSDPAVPQDLRAAMLRSVGGLDGIDEARIGRDALGRSGIVIGHLDAGTGVLTQVLLDPQGGRLMEVRSFTTTYVDPACEPGTFTEHALYELTGEQVTPAQQPWLDWPAVVAACGMLTS